MLVQWEKPTEAEAATSTSIIYIYKWARIFQTGLEKAEYQGSTQTSKGTATTIRKKLGSVERHLHTHTSLDAISHHFQFVQETNTCFYRCLQAVGRKIDLKLIVKDLGQYIYLEAWYSHSKAIAQPSFLPRSKDTHLVCLYEWLALVARVTCMGSVLTWTARWQRAVRRALLRLLRHPAARRVCRPRARRRGHVTRIFPNWCEATSVLLRLARPSHHVWRMEGGGWTVG